MSQESYAPSDQISMVDLAAIFVRRVRLFIAIFTLFVVGGVAFALLQDEQFEYVSLYQIGEVAQDKAVEEPAKAIAVLGSQKLPEIKAAYKVKYSERMPFGVSTSNPENTNLVRLSTETGRDNSEKVKALHDEMLDYLSARHERLLGSARKSLQAKLESVQRTLNTLKETPEAGQAIAEVLGRQVELEGELAAVGASEVLVLARESVERVAPNRALIVVLFMMIGFALAFVAVYFAEFASLVKEKVRNESAR
ncbi:hypothetical protein [Cycloclasticus pugetii]|uniref:hypothetical protein n=1 Tax=Cycloclasticus pugetii TaxID=34068 RepID=UPI003A916519